jgi:threonine/homoserine/homoserine lactone efflux protein
MEPVPDLHSLALFAVAALVLLVIPGPAVLYPFGVTFVALGSVSDRAYALTAGTLGGWLRRRRTGAAVRVRLRVRRTSAR